jgi:ABC-type bacteriocin/lantibiotic exporter with double-glycine peptidase domain
MVAALLATVLALPVPFVAQGKDTCGAAVLAMVLQFWGRPVSQDDVAAELFEPELRGIRGSRLADLARKHGFTAMAYEGDLAQLREYLGRGRPLIVAWKMRGDRFHDVVVVGFDEARNRVVVNDPAEGPLKRVPLKTFEKRWAGAGHWTLLVLPTAR